MRRARHDVLTVSITSFPTRASSRRSFGPRGVVPPRPTSSRMPMQRWPGSSTWSCRTLPQLRRSFREPVDAPPLVDRSRRRRRGRLGVHRPGPRRAAAIIAAVTLWSTGMAAATGHGRSRAACGVEHRCPRGALAPRSVGRRRDRAGGQAERRGRRPTTSSSRSSSSSTTGSSIARENAGGTYTSRLCSTAAAMNEAKSGWGSKGATSVRDGLDTDKPRMALRFPPSPAEPVR